MTAADQTNQVNGPHSKTPQVAARAVGARVQRHEDPRLLTGRGQYLADVRLPGKLHAAFVRSPVAHARITGIDTSAASGLPGVHLVWTGADAARFCSGVEGVLNVEGCVPTVMPLMATDVVRYVGESVAVVVADSRAVAEDAADLVSLDFDELPVVVDPLTARKGGPAANEQLSDNIGLLGGATFGDVDTAFDEAHRVVEATYYTGRLAALPMETRGCIADYDWTSQNLRVWTSSQVPHYVRYCLTAYLEFPEHRVEVLTPDTGGGFGQKAHLYPEELIIPLLARELGSPVSWVEDRRENLMAATHAHEQFVTIAYALDEQARISAVRTHALGDGGAYHSVPWSMAVEPWCAAAVTPTGVYDIPATTYVYEATATNKCPVGAYRGVGYMAGTLAREALADEAARACGMSPFEFRRQNVVKGFPWVNPQGICFDEGSWLETINMLEKMVDYPAFLARQAEARERGRYLGLGLSVFVESSGESTAMGAVHGLPDVYHDTATVRMDPNGCATVTIGLTTQGQGNRTTMAQVAADMLGIPYENVTVRAGESTSHAYGSGTLGSRGAVVAGGAVSSAAHVLREKIIAVAASMLEASPDDIQLEDGSARVAGVPDASVSVTDICTSIYFDSTVWPDGFDPAMEATAAYDPSRPMFSNGGHAVIVEVDAFTGFVKVEKVYSVEDAGTIINPDIVDGQIRGGVVQGIGAALFERLVYDGDGQLQTTTLLDYQVPTMDVSPPFEIAHLCSPSAHTAYGVKGMGESGLIAAPAAVLNAVNDALTPFAAIIRELPATPERIFDAIRKSREQPKAQSVS
ncbi:MULTISPECIES: xanthine dehydrogenase family protein molybdopterin-binding subunit [Amycolatopsis]|uniref:Xanthine dehydrogenase molybdenum binding subunit apoprotein n=1 Tax=Amycolatopsis echigonensis TaxID=2576905 RepID=A0A2N3WNP2_9PSEU|nr:MULTISPECIES: xanthine dehydrogenase family protein molybdopterin-binding subunit [Amycolatopsis]PKV95489.1 xanthine dehydrogenase molybdenum binding subunit apoprotein [Amycolatopsis niigatensis]